jgi:hypothetical protein
MKKVLVMAAVMMRTLAEAQADATAAERTVSVCMTESPDQVIRRAEMVASKIYGSIAVKLDWHNDMRFCRAHPDQALVIRYSHHTPKNLLPGALAMALPFEGTQIEIFYDRMESMAGAVSATFLGHILAHEITHVLQNEDRHSESGLMKARWDAPELAQMKNHRYLGFTNPDVQLIYSGLAQRQARMVRATRPAPDSEAWNAPGHRGAQK